MIAPGHLLPWPAKEGCGKGPSRGEVASVPSGWLRGLAFFGFGGRRGAPVARGRGLVRPREGSQGSGAFLAARAFPGDSQVPPRGAVLSKFSRPVRPWPLRRRPCPCRGAPCLARGWNCFFCLTVPLPGNARSRAIRLRTPDVGLAAPSGFSQDPPGSGAPHDSRKVSVLSVKSPGPEPIVRLPRRPERMPSQKPPWIGGVFVSRSTEYSKIIMLPYCVLFDCFVVGRVFAKAS
jgi:hypothetical protein